MKRIREGEALRGDPWSACVPTTLGKQGAGRMLHEADALNPPVGVAGPSKTHTPLSKGFQPSFCKADTACLAVESLACRTLLVAVTWHDSDCATRPR